MKFGLFFLLQVPRPWDDESEHRKYHEALEQIELADRLGFHSVWSAEHHFLEEYAHCSAPEMFLAAASQRTTNIRLGHGIVTLPYKVNSPFRVAERIAWLDLLSDGRAEFGTGESTGTRELGGFGVDIETKEEQWHEALHAVIQMFTDEEHHGRFSGFEGKHLSLPPRGVRPMPLQKPHPPLWVACPRPETLWKATSHGAGSLCFTLSLEPERAWVKWVEPYYQGLESDDWVPLSDTVNPNIVAVSAAMVHKDETEALERGIDGAHFMGFGISHFYYEEGYDPQYGANVYEQFGEKRDEAGYSRETATESVAATVDPDPARRPEVAARGDRHAGPGARVHAPVRRGRDGPDAAAVPARQQRPRAHLRGDGAVRQGGHARVPRARRGAPDPQDGAAAAGHRSRAGAAPQRRGASWERSATSARDGGGRGWT